MVGKMVLRPLSVLVLVVMFFSVVLSAIPDIYTDTYEGVYYSATSAGGELSSANDVQASLSPQPALELRFCSDRLLEAIIKDNQIFIRLLCFSLFVITIFSVIAKLSKRKNLSSTVNTVKLLI